MKDERMKRNSKKDKAFVREKREHERERKTFVREKRQSRRLWMLWFWVRDCVFVRKMSKNENRMCVGYSVLFRERKRKEEEKEQKKM
jgi:hypothetical protein